MKTKKNTDISNNFIQDDVIIDQPHFLLRYNTGTYRQGIPYCTERNCIAYSFSKRSIRPIHGIGGESLQYRSRRYMYRQRYTILDCKESKIRPTYVISSLEIRLHCWGYKCRLLGLDS